MFPICLYIDPNNVPYEIFHIFQTLICMKIFTHIPLMNVLFVETRALVSKCRKATFV